MAEAKGQIVQTFGFGRPLGKLISIPYTGWPCNFFWVMSLCVDENMRLENFRENRNKYHKKRLSNFEGMTFRLQSCKLLINNCSMIDNWVWKSGGGRVGKVLVLKVHTDLGTYVVMLSNFSYNNLEMFRYLKNENIQHGNKKGRSSFNFSTKVFSKM